MKCHKAPSRPDQLSVHGTKADPDPGYKTISYIMTRVQSRSWDGLRGMKMRQQRRPKSEWTCKCMSNKTEWNGMECKVRLDGCDESSIPDAN